MNTLMAVVALVLGAVFLVGSCWLVQVEGTEGNAFPFFSVCALSISSIWGGLYYFLS